MSCAPLQDFYDDYIGVSIDALSLIPTLIKDFTCDGTEWLGKKIQVWMHATLPGTITTNLQNGFNRGYEFVVPTFITIIAKVWDSIFVIVGYHLLPNSIVIPAMLGYPIYKALLSNETRSTVVNGLGFAIAYEALQHTITYTINRTSKELHVAIACACIAALCLNSANS